MSTRRLLPFLWAILFALPASAQYVATTTNGVPYPALSSATPITLVAAAGTANDRGRATIPLGFSFPYYDRTYTQITVTANGMAFLEPSSSINQVADFSSNFLVPNVAEPNGVLAPFWDDLNGRNPASAIQSQVVNGPNGVGLAIEWFDWNHFLTSQYSLTFQLRVWANGIVEFYYGSLTGNGTPMSATVGIENGQGSIGTAGKACGTACALSDFQSNQLISFGPAPGADLSVNSLKVNSITTVGPNLQISTTLSLRNFGTLPANNFTYRLYLSTDTVYNPGIDSELLPGPQGPLSMPALAFLDSTVSTTVARPTSGSFYILAVVDDGNVVAETNEFNNLAATTVPLSAGVDLVAQGISGPPLGGPGEQITNTATFSNQGVDAAGSVPVKIWLSADSTLSSNDFLVYSTSVAVSGGQNLVTTFTYPLPSNVPAGDYYFILQLDDGPAAGSIVELSDSNNVKVAASLFTARQADLVIDSVKVLEPLAPYAPARYAFFAEPIRLEAVVRNQGGATAPSVSVLYYLSDNDTLNGVTDAFVGQIDGLSIAPGQSTTVDLTQVVPVNAFNGQPHQPGTYFFFAAAVALGLVETSNQNNFLKSDPQAIRNPAPDLISVTVRGPTSAGAGEALLVNRTFANVGNRPAGAAKYRYYLSANTTITESDILLPIRQSDGTTLDDGSVTLAVGAENGGSDVVVVPLGTPAATWYLGVLIDPPGASGVGDVPEVDDDNNGIAGQTIDVVSQALGLATQGFLDGFVGLSYQFQIVGQGGVGSYSYALAPGDHLPAGLTLAPDGKITGTPTTVGSYAFSIVVSSGTRNAVERRAMRVVPLTATMQITSTNLPPAARMVPYQLTLGAEGGAAPYSWSVLSGALPQGFSLSPSGALTGTTVAMLGVTFTFTLGVRDAIGNFDQRQLSITVVDAGSLLIAHGDLPDGKIGAQYVVDFLATNAAATPVDKPLAWSLVGGRLPDGLALEPTTDEKLLITGTPTESGTFAFTLEVEDAKGRSDTADFLLRIVEPSVTIVAALPAQVLRGTVVSVPFTVAPPLPGNLWTLRGGQLPPGLTFDSAGLLSGTVAGDAPFGAYNFSVSIGGTVGVATFRSFSIEVAQVLTPVKRGCGCGESPGGLFALLALTLCFRRPLLRKRP